MYYLGIFERVTQSGELLKRLDRGERIGVEGSELGRHRRVPALLGGGPHGSLGAQVEERRLGGIGLFRRLARDDSVAGFQGAEDFLGAVDDRAGQAGELGDVDAVRTVGPSRLEAVEEDDAGFEAKMQALTEKLGEQMANGAELDAVIRQKLAGLGYEF